MYAGLGEGSSFVAVTQQRKEDKKKALGELDKLAKRDPNDKVVTVAQGVDFDTALKLGLMNDFLEPKPEPAKGISN